MGFPPKLATRLHIRRPATRDRVCRPPGVTSKRPSDDQPRADDCTDCSRAASIYAIVSSERNRRLDASRVRVERVLAAVLALAEGAIRAQQLVLAGPEFDAAHLRLRAELRVVDVKGFE